MSEVREAFWQRNSELSRRLHSGTEPVEEAHYIQRRQRYYYKASVGYILALLWGGFLFYPDSPPYSYQTVSWANLLLTVTLFVGQYLHYYLRQTYYRQELARETWETENYLEGERREMIDLYVTRHQFQRIDAEQIINTMSRYPDFFIDHMMNVELNMSNANLKSPQTEALYPSVCFLLCSFLYTIPQAYNTVQKYNVIYLLTLQLVFPTLVYLTYFRANTIKIVLIAWWIVIITGMVIILVR
jgi:hypothetical protein